MSTPSTNIPGPIPWAQKGEYARGYDAVESPYPLDVMNRALKWMLTASGYDPDESPFRGLDRTHVLDITSLLVSGTTLSDKLNAAITLLPSSGGIIDCRGLDRNQILTGDVTISKPNVKILFGDIIITTWGYGFRVTSAAHGGKICGETPFAFNQAIGSVGGTFIYHNAGNAAAFIVGDSSAQLSGYEVENLAIHCLAANDNAGVVGLWLKRVKGVSIKNLYIACDYAKYNQTCLRIDGAGTASFYCTIINTIMGGGGKGYHLTGSGVLAANACHFFGGSYSGGASAKGIVVDANGNGHYFYGTDIEGCGVAVELSGGAKNNYFNIRVESNTVDATFAAGCSDNFLQGSGLSKSRVTDSDGSNTIIEQNGATSLVSFGRPVVVSGDISATGGYRGVVAEAFADNVAISQNNVLMTRIEQCTATFAPNAWIAPRAGSITGIFIKSNAARSAGTMTVQAFKNGVAVSTCTAVLDGTNTTYKATTFAKDALAFAAGDELDIRITTDASWAPTTADIRAGLEVEI